jgi:hypothetical protein
MSRESILMFVSLSYTEREYGVVKSKGEKESCTVKRVCTYSLFNRMRTSCKNTKVPFNHCNRTISLFPFLS